MKILSLATLFCFVLVTFTPSPVAAQNTTIDVPAETETKRPLPLKEINAFTEAFRQIKALYVEDVDDAALLEGAIRGMLGTLDPHSNYLDRNAMEAIEQSTTGSYGGLGIEIDSQGDFVSIIAPLDDSPAQRAGIKPGDRIVKINRRSVVGMPTDKVIEMLRGEVGERILITVVRAGQDKPLSFDITRDIIKLKSVRAEKLTHDIGYIRISQFTQETGIDVTQAIAQWESAEKSPLSALILDLRNNPGGLLDSAVAIADEFLDDGVIVSTKGRTQEKEIYHANPGDSLSGKPIVVLVNGGSASASEILAGALQDNRRAIIMGEKTFGKGSVQVIRSLTEETAIKLTVSRYYSPNGHAIQGLGLQPDVEVPMLTVKTQGQSEIERESDLLNALAVETDEMPLDESAPDPIQSLLTKDYQLHQAINLIKGINAIRQ